MRLIGITAGKIVSLAFNVDTIDSRAGIDAALKAEWAAKHNSTVLLSDDSIPAEPGDDWDDVKGVGEKPVPLRKTLTVDAINARTREIIAAGYEWPPGSGQMFSLSDTAQRNLSELDKIRDTLVEYPLQMSLLDDSAVYSVKDAAELRNMYLTGLSVVKSAYGSGNALKEKIHAASVAEDLDVIADSR